MREHLVDHGILDLGILDHGVNEVLGLSTAGAD
jgi:hypothetical protein